MTKLIHVQYKIKQKQKKSEQNTLDETSRENLLDKIMITLIR